MSNINYADLLEYIDPAGLSYNEWLSVGMALHHEGYGAQAWEQWSQRDPARYHARECLMKWDSFGHSLDTPVTGGTIVDLAKRGGWEPSYGHELGWDDIITVDEGPPGIVDPHYIEGREVTEPDNWRPARELIDYLKTLFKLDEYVGYVTRCNVQEDGTLKPSRGNYDRTAGQLIDALEKCRGDIGAVVGDYDTTAGAWIRFNPLDGKGVRNDNVAAFRYALVESDTVDLERQNAIIRELELPVAALVHSGNKSIHAIVRVDAPDYQEYRKRVDYLYNVCRKNGLEIDTQNRNPSRLSRMPGVIRGDKKQYLINTNIGQPSWTDWVEWIEAQSDDLPDPLNLSDAWNNMPDLAPCLIENILRMGHKMLIAGASKAGKSFLMLELCIAIAEGKKWLGWQCAQGKVLYVNLELDEASCLHRLRDVYSALHLAPDHIGNIDIWNLRGHSIPMDKLAPKLIRRARKRGYIAVVIDPIYKVITGDENSADQMAHFCNQFDRICNELGCAVIYCHHHSKGSQGSKRAVDRASGSGVFARDPDALLDLIELDVSDELRTGMTEQKLSQTCLEWLRRYAPEEIEEGDPGFRTLFGICQKVLPDNAFSTLRVKLDEAKRAGETLSAWRIESTLREFPKPANVDCWFDWPVHKLDETGALKELGGDDSEQYEKNFSKKKTNKERQEERVERLDNAFAMLAQNGTTTVKELCDYLDISVKTLQRWIKESGRYWAEGWQDDSEVGLKRET